ncbi:sodium:solute symporter family transporter [Lignipirellula cremea]|uniref:Sodium/pantothenate symporter n=1 Tax=Lignipirellula cremea TaxID=2528010 RepID=A0A518DLV9_9BACT|nr:hypothetical protein [Lignipirellula cremea]QDU92824.1 Sodium/pantothenate symporter [Lignipirellula cremea]
MPDLSLREFLDPASLQLWAAGGNSALVVFAIYMVGVVVLAAGSHKLLQSKTFMSEYFLGSRSLGVWAFALTFAATSSSGGSFIGFPALVYTHGWVVALWIGSYMIVPLVSMGLLAKRLNQTARKTGAITIPDVLRDRFDSQLFGMLATGLIVFFMTFNLIAQFKGGSVILKTLLTDTQLFQDAADSTGKLVQDTPGLNLILAGVDMRYLLCLLAFTLAVVAYTTYGGFRAVVWTDVMQGFVMVGGVILMLPLALYLVGGMGNATKKMAEMTPPLAVTVNIRADAPVKERVVIPANQWFTQEIDGQPQVFRTSKEAIIKVDTQQALVGDEESNINAIQITTPVEIEQLYESKASDNPPSLKLSIASSKELAFGQGKKGVYITGPGPSNTSSDGFLPLSLAISFFFMWAFSGAGQPSNMVRLMAFNNSNTLRRAIFTVSIYYTLIYFPLVIIFCCARVLSPGWETEPDRIMPEMAKLLTESVGAPWLAGLLAAAPFAAVMSTMDSFLLMISSAVVRDIYQRNLNPDATEKTIKQMTYAVTILIGTGAMVAAIWPPKYLQDIVVFSGSGLSSSFLAPVVLMLYWPRFNKQGAVIAMLAGFFTNVGLYAAGTILYGEFRPIEPLNFHPFIIGALVSFSMGVFGALLTPAPPDEQVAKFFTADSSPAKK